MPILVTLLPMTTNTAIIDQLLPAVVAAAVVVRVVIVIHHHILFPIVAKLPLLQVRLTFNSHKSKPKSNPN